MLIPIKWRIDIIIQVIEVQKYSTWNCWLIWLFLTILILLAWITLISAYLALKFTYKDSLQWLSNKRWKFEAFWRIQLFFHPIAWELGFISVAMTANVFQTAWCEKCRSKMTIVLEARSMLYHKRHLWKLMITSGVHQHLHFLINWKVNTFSFWKCWICVFR